MRITMTTTMRTPATRRRTAQRDDHGRAGESVTHPRADGLCVASVSPPAGACWSARASQARSPCCATPRPVLPLCGTAAEARPTAGLVHMRATGTNGSSEIRPPCRRRRRHRQNLHRRLRIRPRRHRHHHHPVRPSRRRPPRPILRPRRPIRHHRTRPRHRPTDRSPTTSTTASRMVATTTLQERPASCTQMRAWIPAPRPAPAPRAAETYARCNAWCHCRAVQDPPL